MHVVSQSNKKPFDPFCSKDIQMSHQIWLQKIKIYFFYKRISFRRCGPGQLRQQELGRSGAEKKCVEKKKRLERKKKYWNEKKCETKTFVRRNFDFFVLRRFDVEQGVDSLKFRGCTFAEKSIARHTLTTTVQGIKTTFNFVPLFLTFMI